MKSLEIINVNKKYKNGKVALSNINFSINKGEFVALLGHNGAGKSTLINILASVVNKTSGTVTLNGYDLEKNQLNFKSCIGVVPQEVNFDPFFSPFEILKIQQNLYGINTNTDLINDILEKVGLEKQKHLETRQLSGGMKRRLLIAKALVHSPEVVFLDEPTAGVDIELRLQMWDFLTQLNKSGTTIVLTTHYLEEAEQLCNRIIIIDNGTLMLDMPKQALLAQTGENKLHLHFKTTNELQLANKILTNSLIEGSVLVVSYSINNSIINILDKLQQSGLIPSTLETSKPKLEDIFLSKTQTEKL